MPYSRIAWIPIFLGALPSAVGAVTAKAHADFVDNLNADNYIMSTEDVLTSFFPSGAAPGVASNNVAGNVTTEHEVLNDEHETAPADATAVYTVTVDSSAQPITV
jgi:hypothetical protein